jgi:hypothetical protein
MAEGRGIGYLVLALRDAIGDVEIEYSMSAQFQDDGVPFVSVGGPSVNELSARLLELRAPSFSITYPEHTASYGALKASPQIAGGVLKATSAGLNSTPTIWKFIRQFFGEETWPAAKLQNAHSVRHAVTTQQLPFLVPAPAHLGSKAIKLRCEAVVDGLRVVRRRIPR